ncbi:hypothetical protein [Streptomyces sp. NBC_00038]|uniref:hypothetical protein n=1 Tax=Streptomyces sp. NBC_00038 TaxID=2903615 RepID=UPI00225825BA|nr:hypothetical protein [Streptomyces sp. NBC_00038]MCX5559475.1 hypothetical protein [Streptomyces sp. NBC_00038]
MRSSLRRQASFCGSIGVKAKFTATWTGGTSSPPGRRSGATDAQPSGLRAEV